MSDTDGAPTKRLRAGLVSNYVAFAIVAASALTVNAAILLLAGADALGRFSQTYVVFVVLAQPATFGVHHAVLQAVARRPGEGAEQVLRGGVRAVVLTSVPTAGLMAAAGPLVERAVDSDGLATAVAVAALGLPLHAVNKVAIAFTNGVSSMHRFALYQVVRAAGVLVAGVVVAATTDSPAWLAATFPLSEAALSLVIGISRPRPGAGAEPVATSSLLRFGRRAMAGGLVQEISARVDVIVLALLVDDASVGVFTVAAAIVEGCYQLLAVLRNNLNPVIASDLARQRVRAVGALAARLRWRLWALAALGWAVVAVLGRPIVDASGAGDDLSRAITPLVVMLGGLALVAPLVPFDQLLIVGGRPGWQSALMGATLSVNVAGNLVLVPPYGITGAAVATACSLSTLGVGIWWTARRLLGVDLLVRTGR